MNDRTSPDSPRPSIPAATVVVFRNAPEGGPPQILMVTRARQMSFAGGAAVFPGGRIDDADFALADALETGLERSEAASRVAAVRETLEETGLVIGVREPVGADDARKARAMLLESGVLAPVLDTMGWTLDLDALVAFARWHPKNERIPRIFDTRFYLADLGTGAVEIEIDATENTRLFWTTAADALAAADRGDIMIIFPTRRNLERLARFADFDAARADAAAHPVRTITPWTEERDGRPWIVIPADCGYPVDGEPLDRAARG
ncbi:NUDIX domain-containing protein [Tsuneonella mangrovi]|uniref:NUDIX domain-containing protein n=1 Tax=Tsuneonella mangrovi TaxID=1982042 RepID=UPI000BA27BC5|nr:NUDIX domain-containing protein [Tsuneonella mangrovi]